VGSNPIICSTTLTDDLPRAKTDWLWVTEDGINYMLYRRSSWLCQLQAKILEGKHSPLGIKGWFNIVIV